MSARRTFATVDDAYLARMIDDGIDRVVYVAPGLGQLTASALATAMARQSIAVTIILDADADTCRIGYSDPVALTTLHDEAARQQFPLRRHAGLRVGLLSVDSDLVVWSPTPRCLETERVGDQSNAVMLSGPFVEDIVEAVGAVGSGVAPAQAELGRTPLAIDDVKATLEELKANPPAPFDLARRTRVFSSRFQFVEFEVRGAEWTQRRIKLSNLLLNADLPDALQDILETQVRPYQSKTDVALPVPHLVQGKPAYERDGTRMLVPTTQTDVMKSWADIRDRYLRKMGRFGWLIRRDQLQPFLDEVCAFEETLQAWVDAFRKHVGQDEGALVDTIVKVVGRRIAQSSPRRELQNLDLKKSVCEGLERMRVVKPQVRIVLKNISWESSRDEEFVDALRAAIPDKDLQGWFEEFTAAPERREGNAR